MRRPSLVALVILALAAPVRTQSVLTVNGGLFYPFNRNDSVSHATATIDATGEKHACVVMAPKTGTLDKFEFRIGTVTSAQALRLSFQDVDAATGDPDGTQDQFRDIASGSVTTGAWAVPGVMTSDGTDTGVKRTVTQGDRLAMVVEFVSTAGAIQISTIAGLVAGDNFYVDNFAAAWLASATTGCNFALKYSDGTYANLTGEWGAYSSGSSVTNFNSSSVSDEIGLKFRLPFKAQVSGAWYTSDSDNPLDVVLYGSDGTTVLASGQSDPDIRPGTSSTINAIRFSTNVTLDVNTYYRLVLKPTSTSNISITHFTVSTAAIMDTVQGGQDFHFTARADAGAWTDTTTQRPIMGLLITGLGDNACTSGGIACVIR